MKIVNKNFVVQDFVRKRKRTLPYNVYITHYVLDCSYIVAYSEIIISDHSEPVVALGVMADRLFPSQSVWKGIYMLYVFVSFFGPITVHNVQ